MAPRRPRYRAVLLDWRGIIVHDPALPWWVQRALEVVQRPIEPEVVDRLVKRTLDIESTNEFRRDELRVDTSSETHRSVIMGRLRAAGFDEELAEAMYRLDFEPTCHPLYPDVPDVLAEIRHRGCRIGLVSDFHYDLRPELQAQGVAGSFDAFVISFEHGFQKPDPRMFTTALERLDVEAGDALMVGDRVSHDGGAADVGIDTLILPAPRELGPRGLSVVCDMLG